MAYYSYVKQTTGQEQETNAVTEWAHCQHQVAFYTTCLTLENFLLDKKKKKKNKGGNAGNAAAAGGASATPPPSDFFEESAIEGSATGKQIKIQKLKYFMKWFLGFHLFEK